MLVNVTDVFTSEGKVLTQEFAWETAEITHDGSSYPVKSSSKLLLKLTNTAQGEALVEAKLQFVAGIPCDRCLEEVEVPFDLSIVQKLVAPDRADQDALGSRICAGAKIVIHGCISPMLLAEREVPSP